MTTRDTIESYFEKLQRKSGWEAFLADDMTFTSLVSPIRRVTGKASSLDIYFDSAPFPKPPPAA